MRSFSSFAFFTIVLFICSLAAQSQTPSSAGAAVIPALEGLPGPLIWQHSPASWKVDSGQTLSIAAAGSTDWFISPMGDGHRDNSPRLLFKPASDFVLSAKVTIDFRAHWDGAALVVYGNDTLWAKLCFEETIDGQPSIVSVVTKGLSDDANSIAISGSSVFLKVARAGQAIFFYASTDGEHWTIIRAFSLGAASDLRAGFSSQSPAGTGCAASFSQIRYLSRRVNLWTGKPE